MRTKEPLQRVQQVLPEAQVGWRVALHSGRELGDRQGQFVTHGDRQTGTVHAPGVPPAPLAAEGL